ncbi:MAG: hypothetical protein ABI416_00485 [Ginsengibacter sp.]
MRLLLLFFIFCHNVVFSQSSIYDLSITTSPGKIVSLNEYRGRKILIAPVNPLSLQKEKVVGYWDSLQAANPKVILIIIPANDFLISGDSVAVKNAVVNILVSERTKVKKDKGSGQHPVMQWLTDSGKNAHFNAEVETESQLYFISESGVLYAVSDQAAGQAVIDNVLKQADIKQQSVTAAGALR